MIIQCKKCTTKFRFKDELMTGDGVWVRCGRCGHEFFEINTRPATFVPPAKEQPVKPDPSTAPKPLTPADVITPPGAETPTARPQPTAAPKPLKPEDILTAPDAARPAPGEEEEEEYMKVFIHFYHERMITITENLG